MKPPEKKWPQVKGAWQQPQRQTPHAHQFKPAVAQAKSAAPANAVRHPVAPPIYKPQATPRVLQRKAVEVTPRRPPAAPPAYRPNPTPEVLQRKPAQHQPRALRTPAETKQLAATPARRPPQAVRLAHKPPAPAARRPEKESGQPRRAENSPLRFTARPGHAVKAAATARPQSPPRAAQAKAALPQRVVQCAFRNTGHANKVYEDHQFAEGNGEGYFQYHMHAIDGKALDGDGKVISYIDHVVVTFSEEKRSHETDQQIKIDWKGAQLPVVWKKQLSAEVKNAMQREAKALFDSLAHNGDLKFVDDGEMQGYIDAFGVAEAEKNKAGYEAHKAGKAAEEKLELSMGVDSGDEKLIAWLTKLSFAPGLVKFVLLKDMAAVRKNDAGSDAAAKRLNAPSIGITLSGDGARWNVSSLAVAANKKKLAGL